MFDFGSGELLVIGVVALVVIGPKELPGLLRTVGQTVGRLRRMAGDFQGQFQDALRQADLQESVRSLSEIQTSVSAVTSFNDPLAGLQTPVIPDYLAPPKELQPPVTSDTPAAGAAPTPAPAPAEKPKRARVKKVQPVIAEAPPAESSQAALFDTLDQLRKTDAPSEIEDKPKKPRARKAKPKSDEASS